MESNISIFFIIEIIGTVAFASSGALVAIKQRLDLLGVVVLGVTTACLLYTSQFPIHWDRQLKRDRMLPQQLLLSIKSS